MFIARIAVLAVGLMLATSGCGEQPKEAAAPPVAAETETQGVPEIPGGLPVGETPASPEEPGPQPPPEVRVQIAESDLDHLFARDPWSDEYLPASVQLPGMDAPIATRGLRFRGAGTRAYEKKSFKIRFEQRQSFVFETPRRKGSSHFNLNALWTDPTALRERVSFEMFRQLGVPAPQTRYIDLYINDVFEGLYLAVERIDDDLLDEAGLNSKDKEILLVRDQNKDNEDVPERSTFGLDLAAIFPGGEEAEIVGLQKLFDYDGDLEEQDWRPLRELIRWVHDTPAGPAFAAGIRERFDEKNLIDFLAVHILVQSLDSLDADYWLHWDGTEKKWRVIPWDKNLTFGSNYEDGFGGGATDYFKYDFAVIGTRGNALFDKVVATPSLRQVLHARVRALMQESFPSAWYEQQAGVNLASMRGSLTREPGERSFKRNPQQHHGERGRLDEQLEAWSDFVALRYQYLDRQLEGGDAIGAAYRAEQVVHEAPAGAHLHLTDPNGWVIASIRLTEPVRGATLVAQVVSGGEGASGVNREWRLEARGAPVKGELTLYYRNHTTESWTGSLDPVGRERALALSERVGDAVRTVSTRVNPYSNKATGEVLLQPGAPASYRLIYGE